MKTHLEVVEVIINDPTVLRATKYIGPKQIARAVRKSYRCYGRKQRKYQNLEIIFTIGKPNYLEREFIKVCQRAGETFPVKNIQLKFPPQKKKKLQGRKNNALRFLQERQSSDDENNVG